MHIGDYAPPGLNAYTTWMPRGGDNAVFTFETISGGATKFDIDVVGKNSEDTGPGTALGVTFAQIGSSNFADL